jgi:hypothetical protein
VHEGGGDPIGEHIARPALSGHLGLHPTFSSSPSARSFKKLLRPAPSPPN